MISILSKLLILIDDQGAIKKGKILEFLPEDKKSIVYSALARLKRKGLIKAKPDGRFRSYQITAAGRNLIYQDLDWLKSIDKKKDWYLVAFSIPENKKVVREQFRKALRDIGMVLIQRGLFLGQLADVGPAEKLVSRYGIKENVQIFKTSNPLPPKIPDTSEVEELYQQFLENVKSFLKYHKRFDLEHLRFRSKTLVYLLSLAIKKDPQSAELNSIRTKSIQAYRRIRDYCYI